MKLIKIVVASAFFATATISTSAMTTYGPISVSADKLTPRQPVVERNYHDHQQHSSDRAPFAKTVKKQSTNLLTAKALAACKLNAFVTSNSNALINEIKTQGVNCVNDLFSASSSIQQGTYTSSNMIAVANHAQSLAVSYGGGGNADLEALFLYLRAGFYVEFYNNAVSFSASVVPAVQNSINAFVNNAHFYDDNDAHGKTLSEVIITMDSSESQDVYLYVAKEWLSRWNQSYAHKWYMRSAVNGIFTLIYRGQWNTNFVSVVESDTQLVTLLRDFALKSWMVNSDAEFMAANAGAELGRLKTYFNTPIQSSVDSALNLVFSTYQMYGYGDAIWLATAGTAEHYGNCADYGICNYAANLEAQVLSQSYTCSPTIKIRSMALTSTQQTSACSTMGTEETYFHKKLQTGNQPVANDNNNFLQVNIFDSDSDYGKYAAAIFDINTNNGGMYLEGDPSSTTNVANFVAYKASYANADHYIWNLEHEYVHYLDGRFNLSGGFNAPTEAVVWWTEGVAEYVSRQDNNQQAIDTITDGSTYTLAQIFDTTYDGFDQDRIYRWGYLAVRFMSERHNSEVQAMLVSTRAGNWSAYKSILNTWASAYGSEFTQWTQDLANGAGSNVAPTAAVNGPYIGGTNHNIQFSSSGSTDSDGQIESYYWDFGDGVTSIDASPAHTYNSAGTYNITLTVTDNGNKTGSATTTATVTDASTGNILVNAQSVSISGAQDSETNFTMEVPANGTNLNFAIAGGTGDADLYVKFGSAPTLTSYDCRPWIDGNNEICAITPANAGTYHVMIVGYNSFDTTLTGSFDTTSTGTLPNACATQYPVSSGRLTAGEVTCLGSSDPMWLNIADISGHNSIAITTSNGTGDIKLEFSNSSWPNGSNIHGLSDNVGNQECIYLANLNQYWGYLKVSGGGQNASIVVDFDTSGCR